MKKKTLDGIHDLFKGKAVLHVNTKNKYAWLRIDGVDFYFHDTKWAKAYETKYETLDGKKKTKIIIPYDGWESSVGENF